jgi:hypothetical protein
VIVRYAENARMASALLADPTRMEMKRERQEAVLTHSEWRVGELEIGTV